MTFHWSGCSSCRPRLRGALARGTLARGARATRCLVAPHYPVRGARSARGLVAPHYLVRGTHAARFLVAPHYLVARAGTEMDRPANSRKALAPDVGMVTLHPYCSIPHDTFFLSSV